MSTYASLRGALIIGLLLSAGYIEASAAENERWQTLAPCAPHGTAGPGQGQFEVRFQTQGMDAKALEIRGCGDKKAFRKLMKWGGDAVPPRLYAFPFFEKGQLDFLIEVAWEDSVEYTLLAAAKNYEVVLAFTSIDGAYFNDHDHDGRWEIQLLDVQSFRCANGVSWGQYMIDSHRALLTADTICKSERN